MADEKLTIGNGKPGPGRPKGVPNKTTTLLKEAILRAANEAGGGGENGTVEYLTLQAYQNPAAFMSLLGKVLPMQVAHSGSVDSAVTTIRIVGPDGLTAAASGASDEGSKGDDT